MVQSFEERAADVHSGAVDPSVDNMLKITNDGRKIGLDQRLMNPLLPDDPNSKLNACVRNVLRIWEDGREQKLTQLIVLRPRLRRRTTVRSTSMMIFAPSWSAAGVPENEIEFIHNADTEDKKGGTCSPKCAPAGAGAAGQHCKNGCRHQRAGPACGGASSGCRLETQSI